MSGKLKMVHRTIAWKIFDYHDLWFYYICSLTGIRLVGGYQLCINYCFIPVYLFINYYLKIIFIGGFCRLFFVFFGWRIIIIIIIIIINAF